MNKKDQKPPKRYRRHRRNVRGPGVVFVLLAVCIVLASAVAAVTVFFKVETVTVVGQSDYSDEEIIAASGIAPGKNMFFFNKFESISRIFDSCWCLDTVSIRRTLPGTVTITVTPRIAVAAVTDGTLWFAVDKTGMVLYELEEEPGDLVRIEEIEAVEPKPGKNLEFFDEDAKKPCFLLLNTLIDDDILNKVESINMSRAYDMSFRYVGRFTVRVGTADELPKKLRFLYSVVENLEDGAEGTVDVSNTAQALFLPKN